MPKDHATDSTAGPSKRDGIEGYVARCERTLAASPEAVWQAWTDPALLARWYCPNPDLDLTVEADIRVRGSYVVSMGDSVVVGEYVDLDPPRRLAYTWRWRDLDSPASQVVVELRLSDAGTFLLLSHGGLTDQADVDNHAQGWNGSLDRLSGVLSRGAAAGNLAG